MRIAGMAVFFAVLIVLADRSANPLTDIAVIVATLSAGALATALADLI